MFLASRSLRDGKSHTVRRKESIEGEKTSSIVIRRFLCVNFLQAKNIRREFAQYGFENAKTTLESAIADGCAVKIFKIECRKTKRGDHRCDRRQSRIGFEICRQLSGRGARVVLTARKPEAGAAAVKKLAAQNLATQFHPVDVTATESIAALRDFLERTCGQLDVLINNAGIISEGEAPDACYYTPTPREIRRPPLPNGAIRILPNG